MNKIKSFLSGKAGKIMLVFVAILVIYYGVREYAISNKIANMKKNPALVAMIKEKATANNITEAEQYRKDALWLMENNGWF